MISSWSLLIELFGLIPKRKNKDIKTNQKFIYLFLKRKVLSYLASTPTGQLLSENCYLEASLFLNEVWDKK